MSRVEPAIDGVIEVLKPLWHGTGMQASISEETARKALRQLLAAIRDSDKEPVDGGEQT